MLKKDVSIEYAHIYTKDKIGDEHRLSIDILQSVAHRYEDMSYVLTVMVDDYSFPDREFNYQEFTQWLEDRGFRPDVMIRESQLIPLCDRILLHIADKYLRESLVKYSQKKYPCSLFVAAWYMLRLGLVQSPIFDEKFVAKRLINILPVSFKPYEEKAFEIIKAIGFTKQVKLIENIYFEGREVNK